MTGPRIDIRLQVPFEIVAFIATALFAPWWGTIIVASTLRVLFFTKVRLLATFSLNGWVVACVYRDIENSHAPSRIFAKLLSLPQMGVALDSSASRALVYGIMGLVGFALALFSAGLVAALQELAAPLGRKPNSDVPRRS